MTQISNFFTTHNKNLCSGCGACQQACPFDALSMQPDEEGFIFPVKNLDKCTKCGLCENICPFPKPDYSNLGKTAYGCYVKNLSERQKSSSGALFYEVAKYVIGLGGVVFGACLSDKLKVFHRVIQTIDDLQLLRGSKYVQSSTENTYKEAKEFLKQGRFVYYTGTGCQIAGLKAYLRKDYPNLITSDLVCHGVPPQKLFDSHIKYLRNKTGKDIISYGFRDNKNWGVCESFTTSDGIIHRKPSYILSPYLNAFIKGWTFRYSCYHCPYAHIPRQGDITLADLWGAKELAPSLNPQNGISFVLINTEIGEKIWNTIKDNLTFCDVDLDSVIKWNHNLAFSSEMPMERRIVFEEIEMKGYPNIAESMFKASKKEVFKMYLRRYVKEFLKRIGLI